MTDIEALTAELDRTSECDAYLAAGGGFGLGEVADPEPALEQLRIAGTSLEAKQLIELQTLISTAAGLREQFDAPEARARYSRLVSICSSIPNLRRVLASIRGKILPNGEIDDNASPELRRIRRDINAKRTRIYRNLESLMRERAQSAIQEEVVTVRNGRFVIPVRTDARGQVPGVMHGLSSSGQTTYVEPLTIIDENNELVRLREQEEIEIAQILFSITESLRATLPGIETAVDAIAELDFAQAKGRLSREFNCVRPEVTNEPRMLLEEGRHLLLEQTLRSSNGKIVPISLDMDAEHQTLVISGPNAGGKTVVTKTVGLIALMAQMGLHVPARRAILPVFKQVLADIGDQQSIAANLSTFTAHMKNIAEMARLVAPGFVVPPSGGSSNDAPSSGVSDSRPCADSRQGADSQKGESLPPEGRTTYSPPEGRTTYSPPEGGTTNESRLPALILIDEVGTGTDPDEGAALGIAIVDYFRRAHATTIATTHYNPLKVWASKTPGVLNASVEFDEQTLRPTYRLIVGVAGASSGIEIARRIEVPEEVTSEATRQLAPSHHEASNYLKQLKSLVDEQSALRNALEDERQATADKYSQLDIEFAQRETKRRTQFESELSRVIREFGEESARLIESIKDKATAARLKREAEARAGDLRRSAGIRIKKHLAAAPSTSAAVAVGRTADDAPADALAAAAADAVSELADGAIDVSERDRVRIKSLGQEGVVESISGEEYTVLVGSLRFRARRDELQLLKAAAAPTSKLAASLPRGISADIRSSEGFTSEINVIGSTVDEATDRIDKFLDEAFLADAETVRIVHGHGKGTLRKAVAELLRGHPHVESFALAPPNEGGAGATIATLKK